MKLINATKMEAGYTLGLDKNARESLVVVVKGTFLIPSRPNDEPPLAPKQAPLVTADVFTGEPGFSAPLYESDYAPIKKRCDVLLSGSAYAPGGKPAERVTVKLRVGSLYKSFDVVGNRVWSGGVLGLTPGPIEPFTVMPINYNVAFGGTDKSVPDPAKRKVYLPNHVGVGFHDNLNAAAIAGQPLPNTEETGKHVTSPRGSYKPMALGPLGRSWQERVKYAGTYDKKWLDEVSPFLPADFKEEYFQAAPLDQQMDYLQGGEAVELLNLTPQGRTMFRLPRLDVPIEFSMRGGSRTETTPVIDTLVIEPDLGRFMMIWRTNLPLRRNIFEVIECVAGKLSAGWYRARAANKEYFGSLQMLALSKKGQR
jgi:hypothetical protein